MRKIYLMLACGLMLSAANANAQCTGELPGRYNTEIFSGYTVDSQVYTQYASGTQMKMDIYQPAGDVSTSRPVIILAHGGSFIGGTRLFNDANTDMTIDTLVMRYVRRGYVTVSIDYRLTNILAMLQADPAADAVAKAISDGKAAIRFLVKNRTTYKIDTTKIFAGGNSAGAVLFMHVAYIESIADCSPLILNALNNNGGLEGNSGHPGYTTKLKGVINLAGALNTVNVIHFYATPSVNAQGDQDPTVPYNCNKPLNGTCPDTLCGLGVLEPQYNARSVYHMSKTFPAQGHVPWSGTGTDNLAMMYSVDSMTNLFLYNLVCTNVASVNDVRTNTEVNLFPNPASEVLNLNSKEAIAGVTIFDQTGRVVIETNTTNTLSASFNTSRLSKGMYLVRVKFVNENNAPVVKRVAIQ